VVIGRLLLAVRAAIGGGSCGLLATWPVAAQVALFVVSHDLYIYLFHRWQHASPFLWRFHEAHHSPVQVDWLSGVRSHPVEILVNQTVEFLPLVLLGASPEVPVVKATVSAVWGMFIHANLDVRLGRLQYVVNGPEMHRWHHSTEPEARGTNFSTKLAAWDWLFGTAWFPNPAARKASRYGLGSDGFPAGYLAQVGRAFRRVRLA
jgi:sterol desaturase/sphingolipid hydroxylase (fatty acid hydroxylase superfamily)